MNKQYKETDLFITYTDFELTAGVYFPADLVLGCIIQTYSNIEYPVSLKAINANRKQLIFEDAKGTTIVFKKQSVSSSPYREGAYFQATTVTDIDTSVIDNRSYETDVYCGCMCTTFDFDKWLDCLPRNKVIQINSNALILHPSCYFGGTQPSVNQDNYFGGYRTIDFGDAYFTSNGVLVLPNKRDEFGTIDSLDTEIKSPRLEELRIGDYVLKGPSVSIVLTHPEEDTEGYYDRSLKLISEDGRLTFTSYED